MPAQMVSCAARIASSSPDSRAYAVFVDEKVIYPFALHASVATYDRVAEAFFAAARSVRRPGAALTR